MRDYDIESDLKQEKFQSIKLVQGDRGNKIKINVYEDGQPVKLTGCSITAKYKRADGEIINDGVIENIHDNSFDAVMDSSITKVAGTLKMLFTIEKDAVKVSAFLLLADVREGIGESSSSGGSAGGGEVTVDLSDYYKKIETYSRKEIDAQFKDIAKKTIIEDNKLYLVKADGTKIDNGTKLPTSTESTKVEYYDTQKLGELFDRPDGYKYVTWCSGALRYDKNINKYINLLWARGGHNTSNQDDKVYRALINADTLQVEELVPVVMLDSDGTTDITPTKQEGATFYILNEGTYIYWNYLNDTTTWQADRYTSTDYGKTWVKTANSHGTITPYKITELSNGRLLMSSTSKWSGIYISDDKGCSLTKVTITEGTGSGYGSYVAEWEFIELEPGYIMAIGRKNAGGAGNEFSGDSDHALITYSTDYGSTWSKIQESTTIDNMNASNATGIVHDGIVEIFTTSRWYHKTGCTNNDNTRTGKDGAMFHYVATIEDAKNDNFTNLGVVLYANGSNNSAQDFHAPCLAHNTKTDDILIVYMDRIETLPQLENNNYHYVKGNLGKVSTKINNDIKTPIYTYSNKKVDEKLSQQKKEILTEIEEKDFNKLYNTDGVIPMTDIKPSTGDIITIRYIGDGVDDKGYIFDARYIGLNNIEYVEYPDGIDTTLPYVLFSSSCPNGEFEIKIKILNNDNSKIFRISGHTEFGTLYEAQYTGDYIKYIVTSQNEDELPIASSTTLGGVKVGTGLNITSDGVLSTSTGGSSEWTKIVDSVTTEECSTFEITTDINGNALNATNLYIHFISAPSSTNTSKKSLTTYLNGTETNIISNVVYNETYYTRYNLEYIGSLSVIRGNSTGFFYGDSNEPYSMNSFMNNGAILDKIFKNIQGNITSIKMSTDGVFGVGSRIIAYMK